MATMEAPVLSRLDRLDNIVRKLEIIKGVYQSPKSSTASTTSSGTTASDDSLEKHCRPIEVVRMETGIKGTLMERLTLMEERLLKLEAEMEYGKKRKEAIPSAEKKTSSPRKSIKHLVKSCVKGKLGNQENKL